MAPIEASIQHTTRCYNLKMKLLSWRRVSFEQIILLLEVVHQPNPSTAHAYRNTKNTHQLATMGSAKLPARAEQPQQPQVGRLTSHTPTAPHSLALSWKTDATSASPSAAVCSGGSTTHFRKRA